MTILLAVVLPLVVIVLIVLGIRGFIRTTGIAGLVFCGVLVIVVVVAGSIYAGVTSLGGYEQARLAKLEARADYEAQAAANAQAQAELMEARGVQSILEAAAVAVRADTATVSFWTMIVPPAIILAVVAIVSIAALVLLEWRYNIIAAIVRHIRAQKETETTNDE